MSWLVELVLDDLVRLSLLVEFGAVLDDLVRLSLLVEFGVGGGPVVVRWWWPGGGPVVVRWIIE